MDTGKIRYVLLDMPLESIHKLAFKAAEATHCAEEQGKFWEMHHRLFEQQKALEPWKAHAEAQKAGVTGTPAFLIAVTDPADKTKVKGLTTLRGAQPYDRFKAELEQALAGPGK